MVEELTLRLIQCGDDLYMIAKNFDIANQLLDCLVKAANKHDSS